jgi:hypothetical protein
VKTTGDYLSTYENSFTFQQIFKGSFDKLKNNFKKLVVLKEW